MKYGIVHKVRLLEVLGVDMGIDPVTGLFVGMDIYKDAKKSVKSAWHGKYALAKKHGATALKKGARGFGAMKVNEFTDNIVSNADDKLTRAVPTRVGQAIKGQRLTNSMTLRRFPRLMEVAGSGEELSAIEKYRRSQKPKVAGKPGAFERGVGGVEKAILGDDKLTRSFGDAYRGGKNEATKEQGAKDFKDTMQKSAQENLKKHEAHMNASKVATKYETDAAEAAKKLRTAHKAAYGEKKKMAGVETPEAQAVNTKYSQVAQARLGAMKQNQGFNQTRANRSVANDPNAKVKGMRSRLKDRLSMDPVARLKAHEERYGGNLEQRTQRNIASHYAGKGTGSALKDQAIAAGKYGVKAPMKAAAGAPAWNAGLKGAGIGMAGAALYGGSKLIGMAQSLNDSLKATSSMQTQVVSDRTNTKGNLAENQATWQTRKSLYGPSGRKHKTWKFDFNKPTHVKKALQLKSDSDIKKLMKSSANITKHEGMKTAAGIPVQFAFKSNNGKQLYAGKTIGMRQNIIGGHRKLGLPLPKDFENFDFNRINALFKSRQQQGWYKRQYDKASVPRKIYIGLQNTWKKLKGLFNGGKKARESEIMETGNFIESAAPIAPTVECTFISGQVASPIDCHCEECLGIARKLQETSETSFGQMLRGDTSQTQLPDEKPKMPEEVAKRGVQEQNIQALVDFKVPSRRAELGDKAWRAIRKHNLLKKLQGAKK